MLRDAAKADYLPAVERLGDLFFYDLSQLSDNESFYGGLINAEPGQAEYWLRRGAELGSLDSAYQLGLLLGQTGRDPEGIEALKVAAEAGHWWAQTKLSDRLGYGRWHNDQEPNSLPTHENGRLEYALMAARNPNRPAGLDPAGPFMLIASGLVDGKYGYPQDIDQAIEHYHTAFKLGDTQAYRRLGYLYEKGERVPKNSSIAFDYYKESALHGCTEAIESLKSYYLGNLGDGRFQDDSKHLAWHRIYYIILKENDPDYVDDEEYNELSSFIENAFRARLTPDEIRSLEETATRYMKIIRENQTNTP
jgi:TPR repeat protein